MLLIHLRNRRGAIFDAVVVTPVVGAPLVAAAPVIAAASGVSVFVAAVVLVFAAVVPGEEKDR